VEIISFKHFLPASVWCVKRRIMQKTLEGAADSGMKKARFRWKSRSRDKSMPFNIYANRSLLHKHSHRSWKNCEKLFCHVWQEQKSLWNFHLHEFVCATSRLTCGTLLKFSVLEWKLTPERRRCSLKRRVEKWSCVRWIVRAMQYWVKVEVIRPTTFVCLKIKHFSF
jgi:hypothetical protein